MIRQEWTSETPKWLIFQRLHPETWTWAKSGVNPPTISNTLLTTYLLKVIILNNKKKVNCKYTVLMNKSRVFLKSCLSLVTIQMQNILEIVFF